MAHKNWIERAFCKRNCTKFIPSTKDSLKCGCGRLLLEHTNLRLAANSTTNVLFGSQNEGIDSNRSSVVTADTENDIAWSSSKHTEAVQTDAYGTIEFQGGPHPLKAEYIRLSHDTRPDVVLQLLTKVWNLDLPKLLISVHGGKANFQLQVKLKRVLRKGLVKAAKTTGAWIVTNGTDTGVTRHVGEALVNERGIVSARHRGRVVSIGIAPWGIIENRNQLIGCGKDVKYHSIGSAKSRFTVLNNRHSYFLLVDNGTVGKYGAEIAFRKKLEKYISKQKIATTKLNTIASRLLATPGSESNQGGYGVPVVCVIIEGGTHTIRCVLESTTDTPPIPVVVCDGSGRAADLLAFTYKYTDDAGMMIDNLQEQLLLTLEKTFTCDRDHAQQLLNELQQCIKRRELVTVFRMGEGPCQGLDQAILTALLTGHRLPVTDQLSLALTWNRADIASSEIFVYGQEWPPGALEHAMMDALVSDRVDFVKILLKNGVIMNKFLTIPRLEELYNTKGGPSNILAFLIKDVKKHVPVDYRYTLYDIGLVTEKLMGGAYRSSYCRRKFREIYNTVMKRSPTQTYTKRLKSTTDLLVINVKDKTFDFPFNELLIWSVLMKRQKMALFMWQHGEEALVKSLIACKLYKAMAAEAAQDDVYETDIYGEMTENANEFETLALELLDYCYRQDDDMTEQLLTYELQCWSKQTCISLAVYAGHLSFLAHSASQLLLADLWMGGLRTRRNTNFKVILGLLFPPTIWKLEFKSKEELLQMPQTEEEHIMERNDSVDSFDNIHLEPLIDIESSSSLHHQVQTDENTTRNPQIVRNGSALPQVSNFDYCPEGKVYKERPLRLGKKIYEFYAAPITKFWSHSIAYVIFLCCFTYVVLVRMDRKKLHWTEYYVILYLLTMGMEKSRELMSSEATTVYSKLMVWLDKKWNPFDTFAIGMFMLGVTLRLSEESHSEGRVLYCVNIMYWYLRILNLLSVNKYLGPYVTMIGEMVVNMIYFVVLLLVVLMSYGVARQAILFPNEEPSWRLARHLFFQPYFMLYGEVFADKIDPDCGDGPDQPECNSGRWINPLIMSVYLLVANILLINLLIAVFNNIFQEVNAISRQVWKFQRFSVVMEYESKPVLPPPLIIFSHIYIMYKYCYRSLKNKPWVFDHALKLFLSSSDVERINDFEEECVEGYFREKETKLQMSTAQQVKTTTERVEQMSLKVEDINQREKETKVNFQSLEFRLTRLEELAQQTINSLSVIHRFMATNITDGGISQFVTSASSSEMQQPGLDSDGTQKTLRVSKSDSDALRDSVSPSRVSFADVIEEEQNGSSSGSNHSLVSPFADGKLLLKSKLLQRRLHHTGKQDHVGATKNEVGGSLEPLPRLDKPLSPAVVNITGRVRRTSSTQSEPDNLVLQPSPHHPKVERSISSVTWGHVIDTPPIIVLPATPRPHMLLTDYTSITDELENQACLVAQLALPIAESTCSHTARPLISRHGSTEAEQAVQSQSEILRDAEKNDYHLMEGLIQRRLHRDSENLAESVEEYECSHSTNTTDNEGEESVDDRESVTSPTRARPRFFLPDSNC